MSTKYPEYAGMSYEQASRQASLIVERYGWFNNFERLSALREIMIQMQPRPKPKPETTERDDAKSIATEWLTKPPGPGCLVLARQFLALLEENATEGTNPASMSVATEYVLC